MMIHDGRSFVQPMMMNLWSEFWALFYLFLVVLAGLLHFLLDPHNCHTLFLLYLIITRTTKHVIKDSVLLRPHPPLQIVSIDQQ